ncbi:MAG: hypothetical protein ACYCTB_07445 [bacterium]
MHRKKNIIDKLSDIGLRDHYLANYLGVDPRCADLPKNPAKQETPEKTLSKRLKAINSSNELNDIEYLLSKISFMSYGHTFLEMWKMLKKSKFKLNADELFYIAKKFINEDLSFWPEIKFLIKKGVSRYYVFRLFKSEIELIEPELNNDLSFSSFIKTLGKHNLKSVSKRKFKPLPMERIENIKKYIIARRIRPTLTDVAKYINLIFSLQENKKINPNEIVDLFFKINKTEGKYWEQNISDNKNETGCDLCYEEPFGDSAVSPPRIDIPLNEMFHDGLFALDFKKYASKNITKLFKNLKTKDEG